jgi:xylan 1,4-beta-xylosidase
MTRHTWADIAAGLLAFAHPGLASEPARVRVDFSEPAGTLRALHGVNKGPLVAGGLIDLSEEFRALGVPSIRLHDCHWPVPDVVDVHVLFPDFDADPSRPESYDFRLTDEYLAAAKAVGADIVFRLGESIEHTTVKRFAHPPPNPEKWAAICIRIIRHYNEGWANGPRLGIRHWEIWNEPENRPAMWSGTDAQYFALYAAAARAIKARWPELQVGGPGAANLGTFDRGGSFQPSPFVVDFLEFCRREGAPLDFFSWHCYTADSAEFSARARAAREMLDARGFPKTESHLNEWNYLPDNRWEPVSRKAMPRERERFYGRMAGAEGAAFVTLTLLEMQDAPVDAMFLFHGETGGFGLFNEHGVPSTNYEALRLFRMVLGTPQRGVVAGVVPAKLGIVAGTSADGRGASVLVANFAHPSAELLLEFPGAPWSGATLQDTFTLGSEPVGEKRAHFPRSLTLQIKAPSVTLVRFRREP